MQVTLYTEKTVAQALTALNARLQAKATSTRPALDGWVEKSGRFSVGVTAEVAGRFTRTTFLHGKLERHGSYTVIKGSVSHGANEQQKRMIYVALAIVALALLASGSPWLAIVLVPVAAMLYIPLTGDYRNSETLVDELRKTLKARATPPKNAAAKPGARRAAPSRPAVARATRPATPAPKPAPAPRPEPERVPLFNDLPLDSDVDEQQVSAGS